MIKRYRDLWTAALRSGKYKQGKSYLKDKDGNYCCLGVLCEVLGVESHKEDENSPTIYLGSVTALPTSVRDLVGLAEKSVFIEVIHEGERKSLASMNDNGISFEEIADTIEAELAEED